MTLVATLDEFKRWLNRTDATDDTELTIALTAASEWVEWRIEGPLSLTAITESIRTTGRVFIPSKRPLVSVISITPEWGTDPIDPATYTADTRNNMIRLRYGVTSGWYTTVYLAGLATISARVKLAGMETARHLWRPKNGGGGRGYPDEEVMTPLGFAVPRRASDLLGVSPMGGFA